MDKFQLLQGLMAELRDPTSGCPWDRKQTPTSLAKFSIEEAHEVEAAAHDAVESGDWSDLKSELGDLLFQVVFFCQMAQEQGHFDLSDVAQTLHDKLVSRHPHVWPDGTRASFGQPAQVTEAQINATWEARKREERASRGLTGVLDDVPSHLPALERAQKLQSRAARVGFDWPDVSGVREKLDEELAEFDNAVSSADQAEELGDVFFTLVNLARKRGLDAGEVVRAANRKFEKRFQAMEALGEIDSLDAEQWEARWRRIKKQSN